jgi:hypothetical protein
MIAGVLHTTAGQVTRAVEMFSLEYENGPATERGLYVYNGYIITLTRHHKAKRSINREFFVVRYLPARAGRMSRETGTILVRGPCWNVLRPT